VLQQAVAFVDPHLPPDVQHQVRLNLSKTGALIHDGSSCHLSAKCTCVVCDPERAPAWLSHCVDIFSPAWVAHCAKEGNRGRPMPRVVSMSADIARHLQRSALAVASDGRACGEAAALSAGDFVQGEGCSLLRAGGADLANVPLSSCCLSAAGTAKAVVEEQGVAAQGGPSGHVTCEGDATAALAGVGVQGAGATWLCADHSRGLGAEGVLGCKGCESGAAVSMPGADKARAQQLGSSTGRQQLVKELKALEGSRGRGACGARSGAAAGVTLAPLTLLEGVAWELQHPPSSATRCPIATPLGCSTHPMQGPGQPSDSELEPQLQLIEHEGGAAKPEQLLEEVVFRGPVLTLLLPRDELGILGHHSLQIHPPPSGLTAGALLSHIHQFYAADLQPSEQLWLMQQHPHIRRSLQVAFLSMVPISRLRLLGRTSNFEGLMRISSDQRVAVYTMELSEGVHTN